MRRVLRARCVLLGGVLLGSLNLSAIACNGTDAAGIPSIKTTDPYTTLRLNVRAAVMSTVAPYDTLQLTPTAYDANGVVIPLPGPVNYVASDTTLSVSATGLITIKHKTGTNSYVIARVQDTTLRLTHADTIFILGTTTVPVAPLGEFSIQPVSGDSAVLDVNSQNKTLTVTARDTLGNPIPAASLAVHFISSNVLAATVNAKTGAVTALSPGVTMLRASATYYGVTMVDSLLFHIGYPDVNLLYTPAAARPGGTYAYYWITSNLIVGVNKSVVFVVPDIYNVLSELVDGYSEVAQAGTNGLPGDRTLNEGVSVVFDDPTAAKAPLLSDSLLTAYAISIGTGNVALQIPDSVNVVDSVDVETNGSAFQYSKKLTSYCEANGFPCATARSFAKPGVYTYHSPTTGASGTITVVDPKY